MAAGAAAIRQASGNTSGDTIALSGLTAGRGLVLTTYLFSSTTPTSLVATYNGTEILTTIGSPSLNATSQWSVWQAYLPALVATSGNLVYTWAGTNFPTDPSYAIVREIYDTAAGGIAVDASGTGSGSSTDPTFNVVTTVSNTIIVGGLSSAATLTVGSGYTDNASIAWWIGEWSEYQVFASSGTKAFNWTGLTSEWTGAATAFKAAAVALSAAEIAPALLQAQANQPWSSQYV